MFLTTRELAERLGVRELTLQNLIRYQLVEAPPVRAGRRFWSPEEAEGVRRVLSERGALRRDRGSATAGPTTASVQVGEAPRHPRVQP